eukprot:761298-Hanusia_phi.AAC.3
MEDDTFNHQYNKRRLRSFVHIPSPPPESFKVLIESFDPTKTEEATFALRYELSLRQFSSVRQSALLREGLPSIEGLVIFHTKYEDARTRLQQFEAAISISSDADPASIILKSKEVSLAHP